MFRNKNILFYLILKIDILESDFFLNLNKNFSLKYVRGGG